MHDASTRGEARRRTPLFNYAYIGIFLLQFFVLVACGSYINTAIVCVSWTILFVSGQEQNIIICVLCAISVVLQTYALSINSQRVLLLNPSRQRACDTIGVSNIESLYRSNNIFKTCNTDAFVPFLPAPNYQLEKDSTVKLMHGHNRSGTLGPLYLAACGTLGLQCFRWKIRIQGFGTHAFVPCWPLVRNIYVVNASAVIMLQHNTNKLIPLYTSNIPMPRDVHAVAGDASFVRFSSQIQIPLPLNDTLVMAQQSIDSLAQSPDPETVFVVIPKNKDQITSMHLSIGAYCDVDEDNTGVDVFFHSGVTHLAAVATPTLYTVYSAFSECGPGGSSACNSRLLTSFAVYVCNIALCLSCVLLTHGCTGRNAHQYSVVFVFSFVLAVVTFNWVAIVCIYLVHPASMHGGMLHLSRWQRVSCHVLHGVQFFFLTAEIIRNQFGNNTRFMLVRMHEDSTLWSILIPFTVLDSNIYIENCALYLCSSVFIAYHLYFKCACK